MASDAYSTRKRDVFDDQSLEDSLSLERAFLAALELARVSVPTTWPVAAGLSFSSAVLSRVPVLASSANQTDVVVFTPSNADVVLSDFVGVQNSVTFTVRTR